MNQRTNIFNNYESPNFIVIPSCFPLLLIMSTTYWRLSWLRVWGELHCKHYEHWVWNWSLKNTLRWNLLTFQIWTQKIILSQNLVRLRMPCEAIFPFESFIALVANEWSLHGMRLYVALQMTSCSASVVALVTFERLLSCVHPHHVNFQITRSNARILARCTPMWLFTSVSLVVPL